MRGRHTINLECFVLCLMISIVRNMKSAPPKADSVIRVASETLVLTFFFDLSLSAMHTITETADITTAMTMRSHAATDLTSAFPFHVIFRNEIKGVI